MSRFKIDHLHPEFVVTAKRAIYAASLIPNYVYDATRYLSSAAVVRFYDGRSKLAALIRKDSHRIEKGLALPEPRAWFGKKVLLRLDANLQRYSEQYGLDAVCDQAVGAVAMYASSFSEADGTDQELTACVERILALRTGRPERRSEEGGVFETTRKEISTAAAVDFKSFSLFRFSIRQFTGELIDEGIIRDAVAVAMKTPSVCNRQAWRVYSLKDAASKEQVLSLQNGNSGFGHLTSHVLVVAVDLSHFEGPEERNQPFVDGGMFAMSLCYALHAAGVGTCFLNWSAGWRRDVALRKRLGLGRNEVIITLLAAGHIPEKLVVARSPRKAIDDVYRPVRGRD